MSFQSSSKYLPSEISLLIDKFHVLGDRNNMEEYIISKIKQLTEDQESEEDEYYRELSAEVDDVSYEASITHSMSINYHKDAIERYEININKLNKELYNIRIKNYFYNILVTKNF
jgi:hypothetical protein